MKRLPDDEIFVKFPNIPNAIYFSHMWDVFSMSRSQIALFQPRFLWTKM